MGELNGKLQDTFLFNGTIAENIGYAVPEASLDEITDHGRRYTFGADGS